MHHAFLAALHGVAELGCRLVLTFKGAGEDGFAGNLGGVGVDEVGASAAHHYAVGVRIRLQGRYGFREPAQRQAGVDDAYEVAVFILDGFTVAGDHLAGVGGDVEVHIGLGPAGAVEEFGHKVPVHVEVLVAVAAALDGAYIPCLVVLGVCREVQAVFLEIIGLEGDGAVIEVGIVEQHAATVYEH